MIPAATSLHNFDILNGDLSLYNNEYSCNRIEFNSISPYLFEEPVVSAISSRSWVYDIVTRNLL